MSQEKAIEAINSGRNVCVTGKGGRGKTFVIHKTTDKNTVVCAPTGISALNAGGKTAHSLFSLPLGMVTQRDIDKNPSKVASLFSGAGVKRIIIDEAFAFRADYFDLISHRLQRARFDSSPFGGLQVVVVGDGYQLPPIVTQNEARYFNANYSTPYIFGSKTWKEAGFNTVVLEKNYRQEDEKQSALLDCIRVKGKHWREAVKRLNEWCYVKGRPYDITLCNYNDDADMRNRRFYRKIKEPEHTYTAEITGNYKEGDAVVDKKISLKIGARVVMCVNDANYGFKNGQRGVVTRCEEDIIRVQLNGNDYDTLVEPHTFENQGYSKASGTVTRSVEGTFRQLPVRLGWAISVHKCQGLTLDNCAYNLGKGSFAYHQSYVGLSRVRNLMNMTLTRPIKEEDIQVCPDVVKFYDNLRE